MRKRLKLDDFVLRNFCFFCAGKPLSSCFVRHPSFVENMDKYVDMLGVYEV